jgi:nucleoside-diphosphate-sugar epimerase
MKKIIVSGATGMIGSALVKCAAERGLEILSGSQERMKHCSIVVIIYLMMRM